MGYFFAKAFSESDYKVLAVCGSRPESDEPSVIDYLNDINITTIEMNGFDKLWNFKLIKQLTQFLIKENVDVLISLVQMDIKISGWASEKASIPLVYSAQNITNFTGTTLLKKLKASLFGYTLRKCNSLSVCTSGVVQNEIVKKFGVASQKTVLLPNGIDISTFPSFTRMEIETLRTSLGVEPDDILLINVGRLDEQKGQIYLLRAFADANFDKKNVKLLIVGGTSYGGKKGKNQSHTYAESLYHIVSESGISDSIIFTGWRDDIPRLLCSSDVYVHSAVREGPALPLAMLEAMAARLPVIGTDCSGHPSGFQNGVHGNIVPKCRITPLTKAMETIVGMDSKSRNNMGESARQLVEKHFDIKIIASKFVDIVEKNLT